MNTISIIPVREDDTRFFITVTNETKKYIRSVKIPNIHESFDYELSEHPTYLNSSDVTDFLRVHFEDLVCVDLKETSSYFVIVAPYLYNNVPITQYIKFFEVDPTASCLTDQINKATWYNSYNEALEAINKLPTSLLGCTIRKITIS